MMRRDRMQEIRYLLNIEQLLEEDEDTVLFRNVLDRIDRERGQKARSMKNTRARAACAGAGLLIQKALSDYPAGTGCVAKAGDDPQEPPTWQCFSVEELLSVLGREVAEPCYRYGRNGKPYLKDTPFLFNLSHSGDYVFCGVSEQEIGVDIQKIHGDCGMRLAKRFFSEMEYRALETCGDEERRRRMFFRMWVRKEAYGKLTGEGIPGAAGECLWREGLTGEERSVCAPAKGMWQENGLIWEEYETPQGYWTAVCRCQPCSGSRFR